MKIMHVLLKPLYKYKYASELHCGSATCGNQSLTVKHCLQDCPQWRNSRTKHNVQGDIKALLGKDCEVEQMMKFLKEIGKFEEI